MGAIFCYGIFNLADTLAGAVHRLVYQKSCKYRVVEYYQIITSRALDFNLLFLANDFYHILLVFIVTIWNMLLSLVKIYDDLLVSFRFVVIQAAGAIHRLVYQKWHTDNRLEWKWLRVVRERRHPNQNDLYRGFTENPLRTKTNRVYCPWSPSLYISSKEFSWTPFYPFQKWDYLNPPLIVVDRILQFFRNTKDSFHQHNQIVGKWSSKWNWLARSRGLLNIPVISDPKSVNRLLEKFLTYNDSTYKWKVSILSSWNNITVNCLLYKNHWQLQSNDETYSFTTFRWYQH